MKLNFKMNSFYDNYFLNKLISFLKLKNQNTLNKSTYYLNLNKEKVLKNNSLTFKYNYLEEFLKIGFKAGNKLKFLKKVCFSFNLLIYLFVFYSVDFFKKYKPVYDFYYFIFNNSKNYFLFNINFIFSWLSSICEPIFGLKHHLIKPKNKKKNKLKKFFIFHLPKRKRKKVFLKWFYLITFFFNDKNYENKLFQCLIDVFFKFKKSIIYTKKIYIYKKVLKTNKIKKPIKN
uniref:ymf63 n=1 Tax=Cryptocaryon irritans TaxID=153251 RepID=UPI0022FD9DB4|nr:ymf63 [Cryptocaryon irritans]WBP62325.1 ymf63 [Cryptocaryon irritans]